MLRAILFDFGDTLIDFEPMDSRSVFQRAARSTYDFLAEHGANLPPFPKYSRSQFTSIRWSYVWAKLRGREFNSLKLLASFCAGMGLTLNDDDLHQLAWLWYAPLIEHSSTEEDLALTLASLGQDGLKLGIISNTFVPGPVLDRHLEMLGLRDLFCSRIYSSEVGYRKPDRRIFEQAMRELNVTPGQTMFVGDLVKTDIIGARRMGMRTVLKRPWGSRRGYRMADHVIRQISDLRGILGDGHQNSVVLRSVSDEASGHGVDPLTNAV